MTNQRIRIFFIQTEKPLLRNFNHQTRVFLRIGQVLVDATWCDFESLSGRFPG
jgi:hypothetical protein